MRNLLRKKVQNLIGVRCRWRWSSGRGARSEGEHILDKVDMARGVDAARRRVIAPVATVIRRVPEEDAGDGAAVELVQRCGLSVGVAEAPEDAESVVVWGSPQQKFMR
jgi:hypothetical protein